MLILWYLPRHPEWVRLYQHDSKGVAQLVNHFHHVTYVFPQANTPKEFHEDFKCLVYMACPCLCNQAVDGVEIHQQAMYQPPNSLCSVLLLCFHHHLVEYDGIYKDIKKFGWEGVALLNNVKPL